ncbi:MAG: hypothetical protein HY906_12000 [Deltaproteobacteria bacterium]|nr:hypothetical protein [Deltaproteobacteria bacterium]
MSLRGMVHQGRIEILEGPPLPEGAEVVVDVRSVKEPGADPALAFHGAWAHRDDIGDVREFVSRSRDEEWRR